MIRFAPSAASAWAMPSPRPDVDPVTRAVLPLRCIIYPFFLGERVSGRVGNRFRPQFIGLHGEAFGAPFGDALREQVPALHRRFDGGAAERPIGLHRRARKFEVARARLPRRRSEEHTSELQSLMRISYAAFCLTKKRRTN